MNNRIKNSSSRVFVFTAFIFFAALSVASANGQNDSTSSHSAMNQQQTHIKGFSQTEIEGLRAGEGMGMAKAAELNNYPGPRHVLDLAEELALTPKQVAGSEALFQEMKKGATHLGEQIIEREAALEAQIADNAITPEKLHEALEKIADLRGQLRYTHMVAHLKQRKLLTAEQVTRYNQLRGHTK